MAERVGFEPTVRLPVLRRRTTSSARRSSSTTSTSDNTLAFIGGMKLSEVSAQTVRKFEDKLRENGRSPAMVRKIIGSLGSLLADAQEQGLVARNAVRDLRRNRRRGRDQNAEKRQKGKLKIGVDIPKPAEIRA